MSDDPSKIAALFKRLKKADLNVFPSTPRELSAPDSQSVYIIYDPQGRVCHVGCSYRGKRGLYQRLRNHMETKSSFTIAKAQWHGSKLRGKYKFRYLAVDDYRQRLFLENLAIGSLCPQHIGSHQKKPIVT
jgi:hypothetical protein